ncbi:Rhodanese domain protein [Stigmatella aurantiaca DW4/3-1]|nr:Rhodanese domain protein [Stigmatella aurantiaca DW4/3-1]
MRFNVLLATACLYLLTASSCASSPSPRSADKPLSPPGTPPMTGSTVPAAATPAAPATAMPVVVPLTPPTPPPGTVYVDATWAQQRLDKAEAVAIDVRTQAHYAAGHLSGARLLNLPAWQGPAQETVRSALIKAGICGGTVILYGEAGRGTELARTFLLLEEAGLSDVHVLRGGFAAWQRERLPVEKNVPAVKPCTWAAPAREAMASRALVMESFGKRGVELLDVRDQGWVGSDYIAPPRFSAGHIPSALPFDVTHFGDVASGEVDPEQIRAAVATLGPRDKDPVSIHSTFLLYGEGQEDPRAVEGYLLVRAAGLKAQVFAGGWKEWSAEGASPVVRIVEAAEVVRLMEAARAPDSVPSTRAMLVDLREPWDFRLAYLPGAQGQALRLLKKSFDEFIQQHWPQVERRTAPLIFYCYGRSCVRTREAAVLAGRRGFHNILWFREGVDGWRREGLPLLSLPRDHGTP